MPFAFPFRSAVLAWAAMAGARRGIAPNPGMSSEVATDSGEDRTKNDGRLLLRMAGGDRDALAELYDRFSRPLYATALRILNDPGEAQDVVHDVFISLWEKSALFATERGSAFSWAVTLTRNRSIDRLRSRRRRSGLLEQSVPADLGYDQSPPGSGAAEQAASGDQAQVVRSAVAALPDEQKLALEMAFFGGLTQQEIAQRLNQPLGTVKARIRRGLLKLRDSLGRRL
jgi:RNA polymerase sigma-70 factor, ECF subfamily